MRIGLGLPEGAGTDLRHDVTRFAVAAEEAGASSLWAYERVLWPQNPSTGMYGVPGLEWTSAYSQAADALTVLTAAAVVTRRVRLGTSVLVAPFYAPLHLARALATLDLLSGARVVAGLGSGWSPDEYRAMGADFDGRGAALDETITACRALWADGPSTWHGNRGAIEDAYVRPKPERNLPIMLSGGGSERALRRIAERSDGWLPAGEPPAAMAQRWRRIRDLAEAAGRDVAGMELVPRANVQLTRRPLGAERFVFSGSWDQIVDDIGEVAAAGADELVLDLLMSARDGQEHLDLSLEGLSRLQAAGVTVAAPPVGV